jgi:hypothetical protein
MKALIDPTTTVEYISSWKAGSPPTPIYSTYPNSARVAQVEPDDQTFPIAEPYFWTNCADNIVADQFYYDTVAQVINPIANAPIIAASDQPGTTGTQAA